VALRPRSDWTGTKPANARPFDPELVQGVAVHWNGPSVPNSALTDPRNFLEGVRRFHVDGNGWSDIAYNMAVDQQGDLWVLRGLAHQSGANGDTATNTRWVAVLAVIGQRQEPSPRMIRGLQLAVELVRSRYPRAKRITTHAAIRPEPTACPGPDLIRAVQSGALEPPREDDDMTLDELVKALKDDEHPLSRQLRRHVREAVQAELLQERRGENPPT